MDAALTLALSLDRERDLECSGINRSERAFLSADTHKFSRTRVFFLLDIRSVIATRALVSLDIRSVKAALARLALPSLPLLNPSVRVLTGRSPASGYCGRYQAKRSGAEQTSLRGAHNQNSGTSEVSRSVPYNVSSGGLVHPFFPTGRHNNFRVWLYSISMRMSRTP